MKLLIDSANLEEIKEIYKYFPVDGVTSNPSLLLKEDQNPYKLLKQVRAFIGDDADLHVQVIALKADQMVKEGQKIQDELGKNTFIKIPVTKEGIKAIQVLAKQGANVTGTAIYNQMQAFLAAKAGAKFVAPYVNRIDNLGYDGIKVTQQIQDILTNSGYDTEILGASFKNSNQVLELCEYGVKAVTAAPQIIEGLIKGEMINQAVLAFKDDFEELCGKEETMLTCKDQ